METGIDAFMAIYEEELVNAVRNNPKEYCWPIEQAPQVATRMKAAILSSSYNKDGQAFKATCRRLKIKHTYRDIETFIGPH